MDRRRFARWARTWPPAVHGVAGPGNGRQRRTLLPGLRGVAHGSALKRLAQLGAVTRATEADRASPADHATARNSTTRRRPRWCWAPWRGDRDQLAGGQSHARAEPVHACTLSHTLPLPRVDPHVCPGVSGRARACRSRSELLRGPCSIGQGWGAQRGSRGRSYARRMHVMQPEASTGNNRPADVRFSEAPQIQARSTIGADPRSRRSRRRERAGTGHVGRVLRCAPLYSSLRTAQRTSGEPDVSPMRLVSPRCTWMRRDAHGCAWMRLDAHGGAPRRPEAHRGAPMRALDAASSRAGAEVSRREPIGSTP
jgi:hypothetical protein